jgi:hypothetical protein
MAAFILLQCNINETIEIPNDEKAAETGGFLKDSESAAYSAATFRGGSSAPESWISATW